MKYQYLIGAACAALMIPGAAFAQSTGSISAEEDIVVTGAQNKTAEIGGFQIPDQPKAKAVITEELIQRRAPGQTILDTINQIPGVNFTNSDPYGGSGGNIRIRGFDGNRVSLTFDGFPSNDSGNYALYSNQVLDPELIQQVNVNFGATDVDSPTASASGGTVNYRSIIPSDELGATLVYSHGTNDMNRVFGLIQTGEFTSFGTKAWVSASNQRYKLFRGPGEIKRQQYNAKIYQPLGGTDFISIAGHFNKNRNNFYSNPSFSNLRDVLGSNVVPTTGQISSANPFTLDLSKDQFDQVFGDTSSKFLYDRTCDLPSATGGPGSQNDRTACSNVAATAINPSNTANIRLNSKFSVTDRLTLTFDAAYAYTKANGGGSAVFAESDGGVLCPDPKKPGSQIVCSGVYGNQYSRLGAGVASGVDLNGDGDKLDYVRGFFPSNTRTNRLTAILGLRYDLDDHNLVRLSYTWDRARHRQTGEFSQLSQFGQPIDVFGGVSDRDADYVFKDAAGNPIMKRNRLSFAILHQVSAEYRGSFFEDKLKVALGVRAPFFRRNLSNYCYTIPGSSNDAYCTSETPQQVAANPFTKGYGAPYENRIKSYNAVLPNVGLTYKFTPELSLFASYAKGFSAPRTDNLYAFDDKKIAPTDEVRPEKTDSFDLGLRYSSGMIQAQVAGWYIKYNNRIISSLVELEGGGTLNVDRNVGATETKGVDASIGIQPLKFLSIYGFLSYIDSELKEDAINPLNGTVLAATKGKFVVETPKWQYGGRVQADFGWISGGIQVKHVGKRYVTDVNDLITGAYTLVDADVRLGLGKLGLEKTYLQLNVSNLLKERYFGNLSTGIDAASSTRYTFGAPRTFIGSIHFEF